MSRFNALPSGFVEVAPGTGYHLQLDADGLATGGGFHARDAADTGEYRAAVTRTDSGERLASVVTSLFWMGRRTTWFCVATALATTSAWA